MKVEGLSSVHSCLHLKNCISSAASTCYYAYCSVRSHIQVEETSSRVLFILQLNLIFIPPPGSSSSSLNLTFFLFLSVFVTRMYITGSWFLLSKRISVM